jgi:hypothetical protein
LQYGASEIGPKFVQGKNDLLKTVHNDSIPKHIGGYYGKSTGTEGFRIEFCASAGNEKKTSG